MAGVDEVEVVVAHRERATLRIGDVFLKIDADQARVDVEVEAMAMAPIPTPEVLWRNPPVLALAALPGMALGRLGEPSIASSAAWAAAGAAVQRMLHERDPLAAMAQLRASSATRSIASAPLTLRSAIGSSASGVPPQLTWSRGSTAGLPRQRSGSWTPVFTHGDRSRSAPRARRR